MHRAYLYVFFFFFITDNIFVRHDALITLFFFFLINSLGQVFALKYLQTNEAAATSVLLYTLQITIYLVRVFMLVAAEHFVRELSI